MKNLLTAAQFREADAYTLQHHGITSAGLMLAAAQAFVTAFKDIVAFNQSISIVCGPGNNGGDGLAIAGILCGQVPALKVYLTAFDDKPHTADYLFYLEQLKALEKEYDALEIIKLDDAGGLDAGNTDIIIDALFGIGLNRPLNGKYAALAARINAAGKKVATVDVPSGFYTEGPMEEPYTGVKANWVITFQRPKLNFLFPESVRAMQDFTVVDIGLSESFMAQLPADWKWLEAEDMPALLEKRQPFSHKGTYGHAFLAAGNTDSLGAGLLTAEACLKIGAGLTTLCIPESGFQALYSRLPEVMVHARPVLPDVRKLALYDALAIGPGLGLSADSHQLLSRFMQTKRPLVLDADALTLLSENKALYDEIPENSILTPHVKEFDRLFGAHQYWWERIETARKIAKEKKIIIILKNRYSFIHLPSGQVVVNSSGDPAMASGGMGDVLTGTLAGLRAQGYDAASAALTGVFLHGKAGEELAKESAVVTASQVAGRLPVVLRKYV